MQNTLSQCVKKILYFNHTSHVGGAGWCLYQLVTALPEGAVEAVVVLPAEGDLSNAFRSIGVRVIVEPAILPLMGNSNSSGLWRWSNIRFFLKRHKATDACQRICEEQSPDIVHLNSSVLFHLAEGAKRAGVEKVILHVREHWLVKRRDPREWLKRRGVPRFVDQIVGISQTSAALFGYEQETSVVYDWPDFEGRDVPVDMKTEYGISPEKKVILLPGGRTKIKGSLIALRAMEFVGDQDAVVLLLGGAGTGGLAKVVIRRLLRAFHVMTYGLRLDAAMESLGERACVAPVTRNIKSLIEQCNVVVSPFTTPHFSMPSLEAGLLRRPIIISDNGHARETVLDGQTGLIVPPGDVRSLAEALNRLFSDASERLNMGEAGHTFVTNRFDRRVSMQKLMKVYDLFAEGTGK